MKKSNQNRLNINVGAMVVLVLAVLVGFSVSGDKASSLSSKSESDVLAITTTSLNLSKNLVDNFKSEKIDTSKWSIFKNGNVGVKQNTTNNLVITVPSGSVDGKTAKIGSLNSKQKLTAGDNFSIVTTVYRPTVTGDGIGASGIRFTSEGNKNDEGATISWLVNSKKEGKVYFYVIGSNGKRIETKVANLNSNQAVFKLDRANNTYIAYYKSGNDTSNDTDWVSLGKIEDASLGGAGYISLFANNSGASSQYPSVHSRFDSVSIRWESGASTLNTFADSFSNGVVESEWKKRTSTGATVDENSNNNLVLSIPAGAVSGKAGNIYLKRLSPRIPDNKDFSLNTIMYKPVVSGSGLTASGLSFASSDDESKEAVKLMWHVGGSTNKLTFAVRNNKGVMVETASVKVKPNVNQLTLRLVRRGDKYSAWYRVGDADSDFIKIGSDRDLVFGTNGNVGLFTTNLGSLLRYPAVSVRFDSVNGSVEK